MGRHSRPGSKVSTAVLALILLASTGVVAGASVGIARWRGSSAGVSISTSQVDATPASKSQIDSARPSSAVEATAVAEGPLMGATVAPTALVATATPVATAPPGQPAFSAERYLGKPIQTVPNRKHEVALTFDDGPGPQSEEVLQILAAQDVHATFFVVGRRARKHPQAIRAMAAGGHEVGNHTWTHPELGELSESALAKEIDRNQAYIAKLTGTAPRVARTRGGKFTAETMEGLMSRGLIMVLWTIHSNDVEPSPSSEQIVRNATGGATPGAIILLHETNPNTVVALPAILEALERKGLHPVTMSQLLADGAAETD